MRPHQPLPRRRRERALARDPGPLREVPREARLRAERVPRLPVAAVATGGLDAPLRRRHGADRVAARGRARDDRGRRLDGQRVLLLPRRARLLGAQADARSGQRRPHHARLQAGRDHAAPARDPRLRARADGGAGRARGGRSRRAARARPERRGPLGRDRDRGDVQLHEPHGARDGDAAEPRVPRAWRAEAATPGVRLAPWGQASARPWWSGSAAPAARGVRPRIDADRARPRTLQARWEGRRV